MSRKPPPRGARAGVKADLAAQKEGQAGFEADKKPWHPLNFRNQMKRFEAEEKLIRNQKLEEANKAEFEAEQQYLETLAYLPGKEADKFRDMQGVSWMYIKPPGMKGLEEQEREKCEKEQQGAPGDQRGAMAGASRRDANTNASSRGDKQLHRPEDQDHPPGRPPKERGIGSSIGHRIKFQRRPKSPPIGGLQQGANYEFVASEDEIEVDERLLEALKAAEGSDDDDHHDERDSRKGHHKSKIARRSMSPGNSYRKRRRQDYEDYGSRGVGDGAAVSRSRERTDERHRDCRGDTRQTKNHDRSPEDYHHSSSYKKHYSEGDRYHASEGRCHRVTDYDDRNRHSEHSPGEGGMGRHERSSRVHRTDHERNGGSRRGGHMHEEYARDGVKYRSGSPSGRERHRSRHREGKSKSSKSSAREKERSGKEKRHKRRDRETKDDATLEDALRFIVDQGLSAEDVLNELRSRKNK